MLQVTSKAQLYKKSYSLPGNGVQLGDAKLLSDGKMLLTGIKSTTAQDKFIFATK
jgi:hypothetical protein